jgi:hypothetical protein
VHGANAVPIWHFAHGSTNCKLIDGFNVAQHVVHAELFVHECVPCVRESVGERAIFKEQ